MQQQLRQQFKHHQSTSLGRLIEHHYGDVTEQQSRSIQAVTIAYLMRVSSSADMTRVLRLHLGSGVKVIDYRRSIQNGYYLKNLKLWLWRVINKGHTPYIARKLMPNYGIEEPDFEIARLVMGHPILRPKLEEMADRYVSHDLRQYDTILAQCLDECETFIRKFVYKKLIFIVHSGFVKVEDIFNDLKYWGLYGMLLQYPKVESRLHLTNVCKNAIHNFGINMISTHTTQGRGALIREKDGTFSAVKVSIDASDGGYLHTEGQTTDITGSLLNNETPEFNLDDCITVNRLIEEHTGNKKKFLLILSGSYDKEFSAWLNSRGLADNDELLDRSFRQDNVKQYISWASQFLGVSGYQVNAFMSSLRKQL